MPAKLSWSPPKIWPKNIKKAFITFGLNKAFITGIQWLPQQLWTAAAAAVSGCLQLSARLLACSHGRLQLQLAVWGWRVWGWRRRLVAGGGGLRRSAASSRDRGSEQPVQRWRGQSKAACAAPRSLQLSRGGHCRPPPPAAVVPGLVAVLEADGPIKWSWFYADSMCSCRI